MASYNTLDRFPFPRPHAAPDEDNPLRVSLETMTRWYWRVRRWRATFHFSGTASGTTVRSEHGSISVSDLSTSCDFAGGDGDETSLLRADYALSATSDDHAASYASITGDGAGDSPVTLALGIVGFNLFADHPRGTFDPATGLYQPSYSAGGQEHSLLANYGDLSLAVALGESPGEDTLYTYGSISVPFSVDDVTFSLPGYYSVFGFGDSAAASVSDVSCTITPVEFWGWGGKYDPATGEPLD